MNVTAIYNLALNTIGTRSDVSSPDEASREAEVCNLWYKPVRDMVFSAAHWPSIRASSTLALIADITADPEQGFGFVYALPSDCLRPRWLSTFSPFMLQRRDSVTALYTNEQNFKLVYSQAVDDPGQWEPQLRMAVAYSLAAYIAMPLTAKRARANDTYRLAEAIVTEARTVAANTGQEVFEAVPDWLAARESYLPLYPNRFLYPVGPLSSPVSMNGN